MSKSRPDCLTASIAAILATFAHSRIYPAAGHELKIGLICFAFEVALGIPCVLFALWLGRRGLTADPAGSASWAAPAPA